MSNYLFALTIGPVQSFIAQARKTQDLHAGSRILSDLIDFAMKEIKERFDSQAVLIFPYKDAGSKPNRLLVQLNTEDSIQDFGNELRLNVKRELLRMAVSSIRMAMYKEGEKQLEDVLEVYWAAVPLTDNYSESVQALEQHLGSVKNARDYTQFVETGRKCTVNGFYNALYHRPISRKGAPKDFKGKSDSSFAMREVGPGEAISAITLLKRVYQSNESEDSFLSVSHIAQLHIWSNATVLQSNAYNNLINAMLCSSWETLNAQCLYNENLNDNYWSDQGITADLAETRKLVSAVVKVAQKEELPLMKYYAVLMFDADNMGQELKKCTSAEQHTALSKALSDFAKKTKEIVDNKGYGRTIYAGGDDYLGLLNLYTLFDALNDLRSAFHDSLGKQYGMNFSAGVAIGHYKMPLGELLDQVRKAEHSAKHFRKEKNAVAFTILKHSGEILRTVLPWEAKQNTWSVGLLKTIYTYFKKGVSPAYIKNLSNEMPVWQSNAVVFQEIVDHEIARLVTRASGGISIADLPPLIDAIKQLYALPLSNLEINKTDNFEHALLMLDFINRKIN
jgi:CRISPR-associated protein Cmr2